MPARGRHRPRHAGGGGAVLPRGHQAGRQAHHRARDLRGRGPLPQGRADRAPLAPHAPRPEPDRVQEPAQAGQPRVPRGLLLQAAHRLRAARGARRGHHLPVGVPHRPPVAGHGARSHGGGPRRDRAAHRHLRARGRVHRGAADRHRRTGPRHAPPGRTRGRTRPAAGGHQRRALPQRRRRPGPRRPALHPDRRAPERREAHALLDRGVLLQERSPDARGVPRLPRGRRQHRGVGRALRRHHRAGRHAAAQLPGAAGLRRRSGLPAPPVRQGSDPPVRRRARPGGAGTHGDRTRHHRADGVPALLPHRVGLRRLRQGQRHRRRPGPRLGGGLAGQLPAGHHRPRSADVRPAVRALPEPGAHQHARHRHRLLGGRARARHRVRGRQVRPRPGGPDRHLRHHQGAPGAARRGPGHGRALQRGRPHREAHPARPQDHAGRVPEREGRPASGVRPQRPGAPGGRRRPAARRAHPAGLHPRRGCRHLGQAADRLPAADAEGRRRGGHPGLDDRRRAVGPAQDGLPGPAQPRRHGLGRQDHPGRGRPRLRPRGRSPGRREDLRDARQGRLRGRLPVRVERHARGAARDRAHRLRRPDRPRGPLPSGPDGVHPCVRPQQAQSRRWSRSPTRGSKRSCAPPTGSPSTKSS